jgi:hypothetical protein
MREVVRITRWRGIEEGVLGGVHLAQDDRALRFQCQHYFRIVAGGGSSSSRAAIGPSRQALNIDDILDRNRHAVQQPADIPLFRLARTLLGNAEGTFSIDLAPALHMRVASAMRSR